MPTEALLNGTLGIDAYASMLAAQFRIYQSLESHLAVSLGPYPILSRFFQKKSPWLAADLRELQAAIPPPIATGHAMQALPQLVGMLYVLEGSMLGGQVILKSLRKNPALAPLSHRFYQGNGAGTGQRWREFIAQCEGEVAEEDLPKAVEGAVYAFDFFRENLTGCYG